MSANHYLHKAIIIEPQHDITNKITCAPSEVSDQPESDQSLRCPHEKTLGP